MPAFYCKLTSNAMGKDVEMARFGFNTGSKKELFIIFRYDRK